MRALPEVLVAVGLRRLPTRCRVLRQIGPGPVIHRPKESALDAAPYPETRSEPLSPCDPVPGLVDFERLVEEEREPLTRFVWRLLGWRQDALDDIVQETFTRAWEHRHRFNAESRPATWLAGIAWRVVREHGRAAGRARISRAPEPEDLVDERGPESAQEAREDSVRVRAAIAELTAEQRAALVLVDLEGRSITEAAGVLGLRRSALDARLMRARRALRDQLEGGQG